MAFGMGRLRQGRWPRCRNGTVKADPAHGPLGTAQPCKGPFPGPCRPWTRSWRQCTGASEGSCVQAAVGQDVLTRHVACVRAAQEGTRSEEHTSELQSQSNLVCR